jgi:hypothetical protein
MRCVENWAERARFSSCMPAAVRKVIRIDCASRAAVPLFALRGRVDEGKPGPAAKEGIDREDAGVLVHLGGGNGGLFIRCGSMLNISHSRPLFGRYTISPGLARNWCAAHISNLAARILC